MTINFLTDKFDKLSQNEFIGKILNWRQIPGPPPPVRDVRHPHRRLHTQCWKEIIRFKKFNCDEMVSCMSRTDIERVEIEHNVSVWRIVKYAHNVINNYADYLPHGKMNVEQARQLRDAIHKHIELCHPKYEGRINGLLYEHNRELLMKRWKKSPNLDTSHNTLLTWLVYQGEICYGAAHSESIDFTFYMICWLVDLMVYGLAMLKVIRSPEEYGVNVPMITEIKIEQYDVRCLRCWWKFAIEFRNIIRGVAKLYNSMEEQGCVLEQRLKELQGES